MELVSVIIPVYNVEKYLARCIQSVCGQSYQGLEIILVDDGSKDKSGVICDEYAERDGRIKVIHKENGGLGDARNAGVEKAEGKYLLFVDSDDRIHENLVRDTVETAEKNQADMVIFDYIGEEENGNLTDRFTFPFSANRVIEVAEEKELIMRSCSAVNKLIRRELWKESGFQTGFSSCPNAPGMMMISLAGSQRVTIARSICSGSYISISLLTAVTICRSGNAANAARIAFFAIPLLGGSIWRMT